MGPPIVVIAMSVFVYIAYHFFDRLLNPADNKKAPQLSVKKWDALGYVISSMTIDQITTATGFYNDEHKKPSALRYLFK